MWIAAGNPLQVGKHAITPLLMKAAEGVIKELVVIHHKNPGWEPGLRQPAQGFSKRSSVALGLFLELFQV
jgi:hypothetical protein